MGVATEGAQAGQEEAHQSHLAQVRQGELAQVGSQGALATGR
jgi:hypothetical protein